MTKDEYQKYLRSAHWLRFRAKVRKHKKSCKNCGSKKNLHVHHVSYARLGNERFSDVMMLCAICHTAHHQGTITAYKEPKKKKIKKVKPWTKEIQFAKQALKTNAKRFKW